MTGRARTAISTLALLIAVLGVVGTDAGTEDWRYPCDNQTDWDPAEPVYIHFGTQPYLDIGTPGLLHGIRLLDPEGSELQLALASHDRGLVTVCPVGGLAPETTYTWRIGPFHESTNHINPPHWSGETESEFTTGPGWPDAPIETAAGCAEFTPPDFEGDVEHGPCGDGPDTASGS